MLEDRDGTVDLVGAGVPEAVGGAGLGTGRFDGCERSATIPVLGMASLLEKILVKRCVIECFSACFGCPSGVLVPLRGGLFPSCAVAFTLGVLEGGSTDFIDDCFEALGEIVFSEVFDISVKDRHGRGSESEGDEDDEDDGVRKGSDRSDWGAGDVLSWR